MELDLPNCEAARKGDGWDARGPRTIQGVLIAVGRRQPAEGGGVVEESVVIREVSEQ